jgi:hypothetical protein
MIAARDMLFAKWHKNRTATARELFAKAINVSQRALRRAKDEYRWKLGTGPQGSKFFGASLVNKAKCQSNQQHGICSRGKNIQSASGSGFSVQSEFPEKFLLSFMLKFEKKSLLCSYIRMVLCWYT